MENELWSREEFQTKNKQQIFTWLYTPAVALVVDFSLLKTTQGPEETFVLILIWLHLSLPGSASLNIYGVPHSARCSVALSSMWRLSQNPQNHNVEEEKLWESEGLGSGLTSATLPQSLYSQKGLENWVCTSGLRFGDPDLTTFFSHSIITVFSFFI